MLKAFIEILFYVFLKIVKEIKEKNSPKYY
jgi:hypothetical protein